MSHSQYVCKTFQQIHILHISHIYAVSPSFSLSINWWFRFNNVGDFLVRSQNFEKWLLSSLCLSVHLAERNDYLPLDRHSWNLIFVYFPKICQENTSFIKIWNKNRFFKLWRVSIFIIISHQILLKIRNVADTTCRRNQNTLLCSKTIVWKLCQLWDNVEKYGRARQATDDSMA